MLKFVTAMHIPSKNNIGADRESQVYEWVMKRQLNKSVFQQIN